MSSPQPTDIPESSGQAHCSLEQFKSENRKSALSNIKWSSALILIHALLLVFNVIKLSTVFRSLLFIIAVVGLGFGIWSLRQTDRLTIKDLEEQESAKKFAESIEGTKTPYTKAIIGCLVVVMVAQLGTGDKESILAAGLVKSAVREGEFWRLLTCTTLHAGGMHIWMNCLSLLGIGKLIEGLTSRAYLTIIFLISGVCGSLFSLLLMPNTTSVGASGGIMGLVGFLAVFGYRRKDLLPPDFFKSILINIALIGAVGLLGFAIIDNAAHLGGLIAGAAIAAILFKKRNQPESPNHSKVLQLFGFASLLLIAGISILSIIKMQK